MSNILRVLEEVQTNVEKGDTSESTMKKLKIGCLFIILTICFVFGILPHFFEKFRSNPTFTSLVNAFSGGLFFGIAFFQLLPEANDNLQEGNQTLYDVGLTYYIIFCSYTMILCIERIIFVDKEDEKKEPVPQTHVPKN